jgi:hypothetical protein
MIGVSLTIIAAVTLLDSHFRSIAKAGDGERAYYALDSAVETVLADLVRGADATSASYTPSPATLNEITPSIAITTPVTGAAPAATQQYFDPGLRNPNLLDMPGNKGYLVHIFNVRPGILAVNWAFDISAGAGASPQATFTLRVLQGADSQTPGRVDGCPTATVLAETTNQFNAAGSYNLASGAVTITQSGVYSVAFCVVSMSQSNMTTRAFKPTGVLTDTWVYGVAYKDYQITASSGSASVTAYVRQMPGPTQPPTGNWAANNISWITNLVTPYQWNR